MEKAIIFVLMTLLFLVDMSAAVAMSRNNQLNSHSLNPKNDGTNKSDHLLQEILTSVQQNKPKTTDNIDTAGHQTRAELEQVQRQAKWIMEEIKSLGCRFGITRLCEAEKLSGPTFSSGGERLPRPVNSESSNEVDKKDSMSKPNVENSTLGSGPDKSLQKSPISASESSAVLDKLSSSQALPTPDKPKIQEADKTPAVRVTASTSTKNESPVKPIPLGTPPGSVPEPIVSSEVSESVNKTNVADKSH